jgi:hypothetical protein
MKTATNLKVLAAFEEISFPEFAMHRVHAKIDTGAYSGAIHCTKVHEEIENDTNVLYFSPFDHPELVKKTEKFNKRKVRSSNGTTQYRYFIDTKVIIKGFECPIHISLTDRSEMRWPVLIGRRFLKNNGFLVDVRRHSHVS